MTHIVNIQWSAQALVRIGIDSTLKPYRVQ